MSKSSQLRKQKEPKLSSSSKTNVLGVLCDFLLTLRLLNNKHYELFLLESKPISCKEKDIKKDRLKLQKAMKDSWDRTWKDLYALKGKDPRELVIYGAQTHGLKVSLFALDRKYSDAYRFYPLSEFFLPDSKKDLDLLFVALKTVLALRQRLADGVRSRVDAFRSNHDELTVDTTSTILTKKTPTKASKKSSESREPSTPTRPKEGSVNHRRNKGPTDDYNYPTDETVSTGWVADVYFSSDCNGTPVAVKEFRLQRGEGWKRELQALLVAHAAKVPHIVPLLDYYTPSTGLSVTMADAILVFPRLEPADIDGATKSLEEKVRLFKQLMTALEGLHALHIVHMDVKPSNLMIDPETQDLLLIDFDLSGFHCPLDQWTKDCSGTRGFRAPETEIDGIWGPASDIYSAGLGFR